MIQGTLTKFLIMPTIDKTGSLTGKIKTLPMMVCCQYI